MLHRLLALISIVYPLLWFFGQDRGWFPWLALGMAMLWGSRAVFSRHKPQRLLAFVLSLFFVLIWLFRQPDAMYWYPIAVNLLMLALFGGSLFSSQSLIERLARLQHPDLPESGVRYTRKVTLIWCGFFVFNALITLYLIATAAWSAWAIYTGVIAYLLMGLLFGAEWLYRYFVLKIR
ncbi:membrane protein [Stenoxybacter acetivorans]|uniref:COG4648 family protein n=1 Tax=Stenoxybacter acetivorans TaxID=422441 RepID=UPI00055B9F49|nr:membrane protein [Stenoxybacter acetivorans]